MGEVSLPLSQHPAERVTNRALALLPDDRLARLAADGNRAAFAAIYRRHHQALYRYCRSILSNSEEAEDALQNTMLSALRSLPGEQRRISLKPWLFRVAHNEAISVVRRRSPDAPIDLATTVASEQDDPAVRERLQGLIGDLGALPERQRSALVMRELNGLSYPEIGGALGATEAAAKQLVYEARTALHEVEEGRQMECEAARATISARDGRRLRSRKLRAHLRSCDGCRGLESSIAERQAGLAALAPPLPAPVAAALLEGILGSGGGTGGGLAGLAAGAAGESLGGTAAFKAASVAVAASLGVAGAGVVVGAEDLVPDSGLDRQQVASSPAHDGTERASGKGRQAGGNHHGDGTAGAKPGGSGAQGNDGPGATGGGGSGSSSGSSAAAPVAQGGGGTVGALGETIGQAAPGGTGGVVDDVDQAVEGSTGVNPGLGEATGPVTGPVDDVLEGNVPDVEAGLPDLGLPGGNQGN